MDLIQRDVLLAGQGVPWLGQAFTITDFAGATDACVAGLNGCGTTPGTLGAVAAGLRGGGDVEAPDILEIISAEEQCPYYSVCDTGGAELDVATPIIVREPPDINVNACMTPATLPTLLLATNNFNFAIVAAAGGAPFVGACPAGAGNRSFTLVGPAPVGQWANKTAGGLQSMQPAQGLWLTQARIARYEIAMDPVDGITPSLWRSTTGLWTEDGAAAGKAGAGVGTWQLVARGIEDMQVEYMDAGGNWMNQPQPIDPTSCGVPGPTPGAGCPNPPQQGDFVVRQVRVTLSARSMAPAMVGAIPDGNQTPGTEALRGQLQSVTLPRAAKVSLGLQ
jgi:hypothetical protein